MSAAVIIISVISRRGWPVCNYSYAQIYRGVPMCTRWKSSHSDKSIVPDDEDTLLQDRHFDYDAASLEARGFLRSHKPYSPPNDVEKQIVAICRQVLESSDKNSAFFDPSVKFNLLSQCAKKIGHVVPNSLLSRINNVRELVMFYKTPVDITNPLDRMKSMDLPKNLHVTYSYTRFHPETDTLFKGISAFPRDGTIITGLKSKKKYRGYSAQPIQDLYP